MFSGHYNLVDNSPVLQAAIDLPVPSDTALGYQDVDNIDLGTSVNAFPRRKGTVKNDRHSKIFTATGPRDRRVRLSISIARKFFDLQDMLGFDKPSKTLDWLLTNSRTAIKELIRTKQSTLKKRRIHNRLQHYSLQEIQGKRREQEQGKEQERRCAAKGSIFKPGRFLISANPLQANQGLVLQFLVSSKTT